MMDLSLLAVDLQEELGITKPWLCDNPTCDGRPHDSYKDHARASQRLPDDLEAYTTHCVIAGRGWGKTYALTRNLAHLIANYPYTKDGTPTRFAILGPTHASVRDNMIHSDSGLLRAIDETLGPGCYFHNKAIGLIVIEETGQRISYGSGDSPDGGASMRGSSLFACLIDEIGVYKHGRAMLNEAVYPAMRQNVEGCSPKVLIGTTPKRASVRFLRELIDHPSTRYVSGSTFENHALSQTVLDSFDSRYREGSNLRRQELEGSLVLENEDSLFDATAIDEHRVTPSEVPHPLKELVIGVDPSVSSKATSDEVGIVVVGCGEGTRSSKHFYILEDGSGVMSPEMWAKKTIELFSKHDADSIVVESNQGGDVLLTLLGSAADKAIESGQLTRSPNIRKVHSRRGKYIRAEVAASLLESGRLHFVGNEMGILEEQLSFFESSGNGHDDRLDSMVHAINYLAARRAGAAFVA
jgi:phage terminase large subunit-like protein